MDATTLNLLRDPAGVPFYPVVFQALYILTWALHAAFVLLSLGSMGLSLVGGAKQKNDENWKILTGHLIQTGKLSVSLLIVLGVAPLLFTQVIYDPNWYTVNALSGIWIFVFIYALVVGYSMYYWYYYANKKGSSASSIIGIISFLVLVFCGFLMHSFAVESIQPDKWMQWYAPNGVVDTSGLNLHFDLVRLAFMVSLAVPVVGIFLQNYSDFLNGKTGFSEQYTTFTRNMGTKLATVGLLISAVLFVVWMLQANALFSIVSIATVVGVLVLLFMVMKSKNSYLTTGVLVVVALLISGVREYLKFNLMMGLGYNIYDYPMNIDWPSVAMFLLTFVSLGFVGVAFILAMAWKIGKSDGVFDGTKSPLVTKLANSTLWILLVWCGIYFSWGLFTLFANSFA